MVINIAHKILSYLADKPEKGIIAVLILVICYQYTLNLSKDKIIVTLKAEKVQIENTLNQKIEILKNSVTVTSTDKTTGKTSKKETYVPPEGKVEIIMDQSSSIVYDQPSQVTYVSSPPLGTTTGYLNNNLNNVSSIVKITDKGFCFRPGIGALYDFDKQELKAQLDVKFGYLKRFSGIASFDKEYGSIAITRHIDDVMHGIKNIEIGIYAGLTYDTHNSRVTIGMRSNW